MMTRNLALNWVRVGGALLLLAAFAATPALAKQEDQIHIAGIVIVGEVKSLERGQLRISTDLSITASLGWSP